MHNSQEIQKAKEIILSVRGKSLSRDERKEKAVELAVLMLRQARLIETKKERRLRNELAKMMEDSQGKNFLIQMTDQAFRSKDSKRIVDQIQFLLQKYGVPKFLSQGQRFAMHVVSQVGSYFPKLFDKLTKYLIRERTASLILPANSKKLERHIKKRAAEGIKLNINHIGEAILGEEEAKRRLNVYLNDLANPSIDCISVKISAICSQINIVAFESTLELISSRLILLYRAAKENLNVENGKKVFKFVYLDMEEYRDLHLTVEAFKRVLEKEEFKSLSAGIVLQSYLPDSFLVQQELTIWAMKRVNQGGALIKIRLVKGANLAMEQVEASLKGWPPAPFDDKSLVDANYIRMIDYGTQIEHIKSAELAIASHNLLDIAYALVLISERQVEKYASFEMLEGMAEAIAKVVRELSGNLLLYCPVVSDEEFQNAVAYLVRRLDENTAPGNFLREAFSLNPKSENWKKQVELFYKSCDDAANLSFYPRRSQNRFLEEKFQDINTPFQNEADTDFSLPQNRSWAMKIVNDWSEKKLSQIPLNINGEFILTKNSKHKSSFEKGDLYSYSIADSQHIETAIQTAVSAVSSPLEVRARISILAKVAHYLRLERGNLIGAMILDNKKTVEQADVEVSEAIDFAEYYLRVMSDLNSIEEIKFSPKGVVLVASPWNFPCSIAAGGILSAFVTGNSVIFKPAEEAILVGFHLAKIFWKSGIPSEFLQFVVCEDEPIGSLMIKDPRINSVILTGATATAKTFLNLRPGIDLMAETGGKNAMIITSLADRDLSIKELCSSAFSFSGQKCSACSLAICEKEVYDDENFREQLKSAVASLKVGSAYHLDTKINPLIGKPNAALYYGLTELEEGEEWLLQPKQDEKNPDLWTPGIRLHAKPGSISHTVEFFGPVLTLMRADDLKQAIELANGTPYGLTSGLQSLDVREQQYWIKNIEAGNCYINRGITGAIVQRQPFGGCKESSFGPGLKAGGPSYLIQLMQSKDILFPKEQLSPRDDVKALATYLPNESIRDRSDFNIFQQSIGSYAFFFHHLFCQQTDVSLCRGQDNYFKYVPRKGMVFRILPNDALVDILRVIAAAKTCHTELEISASKKIKGLNVEVESDEAFLNRVREGKMKRIRLLQEPDDALKNALAISSCNVIHENVSSHGRIELLNYLREVAISIDYHRYGNLVR